MIYKTNKTTQTILDINLCIYHKHIPATDGDNDTVVV